MKAKHNLKPIYDKNSEILILGTMPSTISRSLEFYYANPQNRFWKVLEVLFSQDLSSINNRKEFLKKHNIALWDVISSCDILGSSDSSIKNIKVNDIDQIIKAAEIKCIFCTGKTAYKLFLKNFHYDIPIICLPSPSSANATYSLDKLIIEYKQILNYLTIPK